MQTEILPKASRALGHLAHRLSKQAEQQLEAVARANAKRVRQIEKAADAREKREARLRAAHERKIRPRIIAANLGLSTIIAFAQSREIKNLFEAQKKMRKNPAFWFYDAHKTFFRQGDELEEYTEVWPESTYMSIEFCEQMVFVWYGTDEHQFRCDFVFEPFQAYGQGDRMLLVSHGLVTVDDPAYFETYADFVEKSASLFPTLHPLKIQVEPYTTWNQWELFFQILMDCSNTKKFNQYLTYALKNLQEEDKAR